VINNSFRLAVRHHPARGGDLEQGAQEVQPDEEVHGEAGELQLCRRPGPQAEVLTRRHCG